MSDLLPYIVIGLTFGSVYALGGVGLVLTYKTSGILNFGYGAIATLAAYVFYALHVDHGMSWPLAAVISVLGLGTVVGILFEPFARALARRPLAMQVAATVGFALAVQAFFIVKYGQDTRLYPQFLPVNPVEIFGAVVTVAQLITIALVLAMTIVFYTYFRRARMGIAMRAVVDNPELLDLAGTSPRTVRRAAWVVGSIFAALSGILLAPSLTLSATALTLLVLQTFGAAAIGRFSSIPLTYVGGLAIGVGASLLTKYITSTSPIVAGIPASLPFLVLFGAMLFMPRRWLVAPAKVVPVASAWVAPLRVQIFGIAVLIAFFVLVPGIVGDKTTAWTTAVAWSIILLSLGLLVRSSGQVSLCQVSFAAIGAAGFSHFAVDLGIPWLAALLLCGIVAIPVGILLAVPAIRLGGIYLALATFGFGIVLQGMFYRTGFMFGTSGLEMPAPHLSFVDVSTDKGIYYVVLTIAVICWIAVFVVSKTRLGRLLGAMADSQVALSTNGASISVSRVLVFSISSFLAAIGGALLGVTNSFSSPDDFDPIISLTLIALIVITVGDVPWYAVLAAAGFVIVPIYITSGDVNQYLQIFFGVSAMGVALSGIPTLPPWITDRIDRLGGRGRPRSPAEALPPAVPASAGPAHTITPGELQLSDLTVRFGGLKAVDGLSLTAPTGRITGLIGPNGAGKTTSFNAICGIVRPSQGTVTIDGREITRSTIDARARSGLGRTFQQMELFDSLTVAQNVAVGREGTLAGKNPVRHVLTPPPDRGTIDRATGEALELCGLTHLADTRAVSLSTGERRRVELARCLAGPYRYLLLDEPSSGLDHIETQQFGEILEHVVRQRGVGILLVEHDMSLVMRVCDHIHVLDFGVPLYDGTPAQVTESPLVRAAYLGTEDAQPEGSDEALAEPPA